MLNLKNNKAMLKVMTRNYAMDVIVISDCNNFVSGNVPIPVGTTFYKAAVARGYSEINENEIKELVQWKQDQIQEHVTIVKAKIDYIGERRHHLDALIAVIIAENGKKYYEKWKRYIETSFILALKHREDLIKKGKDIDIIGKYTLPITIL